jgi:hypothetical protein
MSLRKINVPRLGWSGLVYRIFIICCNALFFATGLKPALQNFGVIGASICWNIINMCLYYLYHYWFLRMFKMGIS